MSKRTPEHSPTSTDRLLAETRRYRVLTAAQEKALAVRAKRGDIDARRLLVLHNLRFANEQARRDHGTGAN